MNNIQYFMKSIPENIFFKDTNCRYIYASEICEKLNKQGENWTIIGKTDLEVQLFPELGRQYYEEDKKLIRDGGSMCYTSVFPMEDQDYYYEVKKTAVKDDHGKIIGIVGVVNDVTELMQMRKIMDDYYMTDPVTRLYNKKYLEAWQKVEIPVFPLSLIVCDCNSLKYINDTYGHEYGNQLLESVGKLFHEYLSDDCISIREGGDEFLIICNNTDEEEAQKIIEKLSDEAKNIFIKDRQLSIAYGAVTVFNSDYDFDACHKVADGKMYAMKQQMKKCM